jgi:hypothetical protein
LQLVAQNPRSLVVAVMRTALVRRARGSVSHSSRGTAAAGFITREGETQGLSKRCVALRTVASAYVPSPKSTLIGVFQNLGRAVRANKSLRIAGRFARTPSESVSEDLVSVAYRVPSRADTFVRH